MILERMKLTSLGRMPHIASKVVDFDAVALVTEWIASLSQPGALEKAGAIHPRLPNAKEN